jgi:hypothetical protein
MTDAFPPADDELVSTLTPSFFAADEAGFAFLQQNYAIVVKGCTQDLSSSDQATSKSSSIRVIDDSTYAAVDDPTGNTIPSWNSDPIISLYQQAASRASSHQQGL